MEASDNIKHVESNVAQATSGLYEITKSVHSLPRELRDIIYAYILEDNNIHKISNNSNVRLDRFPKTYEEYRAGLSFSPRFLPDFMDAKKAFLPFVHDIVQIVYEKHPRLWVESPSEISHFLDFDFFDCGLTPRQVKLSNLHISGILEPGLPNSVNMNTLKSDLSALLEWNWGPPFTLEISLYTLMFSRENNKRIAKKSAEILHSVRNIVLPFVEKARERGANVTLILSIMGKSYYNKDGQNDMLPTREAWAQDMKEAYDRDYHNRRRRRRRHRGPSAGPYWPICAVCMICFLPVLLPVVIGHGVVNYSIDFFQKKYKECKAKRQAKYGSMWSFKKK